MIMEEDESDEHLKIFECLVNTGALVLRNSLERKVLHNIPITFEQYLENTKHQFYHQFERNRNKPCCSGQPHNCYVNGNMDKKIFYKVYNKISELDYQHCLDRFQVKADVSIDELDLSDLNFFLWNSNTLSQQEVQSLQTIMTIRSAICHPQSSHCYSINDLEHFWVSLQNAVLLFAEPDSYKKIVTLLITTQKKSKVNEIESNRIINEMHTESGKITHELKLEVQARNDCTNQLMKAESVGIKNCIKDTYDKTKSLINEKVQKLTENHKVLTTRCTEEIKTTVTEESSNTRLHNEDQRRAIDSKLTESENRVCQTVVHSGGRLEDQLSEQTNEIRKHSVELNAVLKEKDRKLTMLTAEVTDVKTEMKELNHVLKTILIDNDRKQKVELVMNTEKTERSKESPDNGKVEMTVKVNQARVTEDKENEIIENLPPEVEIQTNNDSSPEEAETETIQITGKKVNSIILELKATPGILHSVENFKAAILTLVRVMQKAGGIDADIEDTVTVNLKFESPLTADQFAVVKCLFAKEWNADNDTTQLPETSEVFQLETTKPITKTFCQLCDNKDRRIKTLEKHEIVIMRNMLDLQREKIKLEDLLAEKRKLEDTQAEKRKQEDLHAEKRGLLIQPPTNITDMIRIPKEKKSSLLSSLGLERTYDSSSKKTLYECRNCYEMEIIIIQLYERLCEIRRRIIETAGQPSYLLNVNKAFEDLLKITDQNNSMTSIEEKGRMKDKELRRDRSIQDLKHISDFNVRDLETKANKKLMDLQSSQGPMPGFDQTEEKCNSSLRISEIRRNYGRSSYKKTDKQKGIGIIIDGTRHLGHSRDPDTTHLQEFFEEIGFVVKWTEERDWRHVLSYMIDEQFYCVFIVLKNYMKYGDEYLIRQFLSEGSIGKPVIIMTDFPLDFSLIKDVFQDTDRLIVMACRHKDPKYKSIFDDFMKVTRINRFADIIDILKRISSLYDYPVITFESTLRKKFCFL